MVSSAIDANCRIIPKRLTATTLTDIFTATGYMQILGIRAVNFHAVSTPSLNLQYFSIRDATSFYLQANYVMPVATSLWFHFDGFALYEGDKLQAQASIASCIDILAQVVEVPGRST